MSDGPATGAGVRQLEIVAEMREECQGRPETMELLAAEALAAAGGTIHLTPELARPVGDNLSLYDWVAYQFPLDDDRRRIPGAGVLDRAASVRRWSEAYEDALRRLAVRFESRGQNIFIIPETRESAAIRVVTWHPDYRPTDLSADTASDITKWRDGHMLRGKSQRVIRRNAPQLGSEGALAIPFEAAAAVAVRMVGPDRLPSVVPSLPPAPDLFADRSDPPSDP